MSSGLFGVGIFEDGQDFGEGIGNAGACIDGEGIGVIVQGLGMAVGIKHIDGFAAVVGAGVDAEEGEAGIAEEVDIDDEGADGEALIVEAEVGEFEMAGAGIDVDAAAGGVAVVVIALGLAEADIGKLLTG